MKVIVNIDPSTGNYRIRTKENPCGRHQLKRQKIIKLKEMEADYFSNKVWMIWLRNWFSCIQVDLFRNWT